jgi:hypothetical protein
MAGSAKVFYDLHGSGVCFFLILGKNRLELLRANHCRKKAVHLIISNRFHEKILFGWGWGRDWQSPALCYITMDGAYGALGAAFDFDD